MIGPEVLAGSVAVRQYSSLPVRNDQARDSVAFESGDSGVVPLLKAEDEPLHLLLDDILFHLLAAVILTDEDEFEILIAQVLHEVVELDQFWGVLLTGPTPGGGEVEAVKLRFDFFRKLVFDKLVALPTKEIL